MDAAHGRPLLDACRILFGLDAHPAALTHLHPRGLHRAWRRRALLTHPDRVAGAADKRLATERFIEAARAYALLRDFLALRDQRGAPGPAGGRPPRPQRQRTASPGASRPCHEGGAGPLPRRHLRLGEFLHRERAIAYEQLIAAILWQRRQRERFCEICRRWGLLSEHEIRLLLEQRVPGERIGGAAVRLRLLSGAQIGAVLNFQRARQRPLGEYFLERGLISPSALDALLVRFAAHNASCPRRPSR